MKLYWVKTGKLIKKLFNGFVWDMPNTENTVYLTFDDGPMPGVTEWVLDVLEQYEAKATFFCIGNNINSHPDIFKKVIEQGHAVANHTYNHVNGWRTDYDNYIKNFTACEEAINKYSSTNIKLFRPPYGKIKRAQAKQIRHEGYRIVMWDVLSADFDTAITPQKCLQNVIRYTTGGSIIIFHDSVKAFPNLEYTLPRALQYLKEKGYVFKRID